MKKLLLILVVGLFLFPHATHAQSLTYQQLLDQNTQLTARVQTLLTSNKVLSDELLKYESNLPMGCTTTGGFSPITGQKCDGSINKPTATPTDDSWTQKTAVVNQQITQLTKLNDALNDLSQQQLTLKNTYYQTVAGIQKQPISVQIQLGKINALMTDTNTKLQQLDLQKQQLILTYNKSANAAMSLPTSSLITVPTIGSAHA